MIAPNDVAAIRKLLNEGHSHREIARKTGISRGTVGSIASGKRTDRVRQPRDECEAPLGPIGRCPQCGGRVFTPCLLCQIRKLKSVERADRRRTAGREEKPTVADMRRRCDPTFPPG